jgi:hypothetical protein
MRCCGLVDNDQRDCAVGEHEGKALRRVSGIERKVGGSGLEDREHGDNVRDAARKKQADDGPRGETRLQERGGEFVRAAIELRIG